MSMISALRLVILLCSFQIKETSLIQLLLLLFKVLIKHLLRKMNLKKSLKVWLHVTPPPTTPRKDLFYLIFIAFAMWYIFNFFTLYWSIVDYQCVNLRCTAKRFSYTYTCIYRCFFWILFPFRLLQSIEWSSLCYNFLYQLSHKGSPRILKWVAYPFSRGSSRPRNQTGISCNAGRFFTSWAIREAPVLHSRSLLVIYEYFKYSSMYMLIPNSQTYRPTFPTTFPPDDCKFIL